MFASMFNSLLNKSVIDAKKETIAVEAETVKITRKDVENLLTELEEIKDNSDTDDNYSVTKDNVTDAIELLSISDDHPQCLNDSASIDNVDDIKSEVSSIGENQLDISTIEDPDIKKIVNKINGLQCLFTWNIKSKNKKSLISCVRNKYGEYNLNITSSEFTLERFIGNLIISYELFHNGEPELAQMKILEIGKWLEDLDKSTDEFYLSIKTGLQHVMKATFIHMLFATNLTGECKWLLDDIILFSVMDSKSRASVHAIRAAVLIEYGGNIIYIKKACEMAKKACDLDPKTSEWFYIYSLALTAHRHFLLPYKSIPTENELNTIHQAILLSNGKNTLFNYHKMVLYRDTTIGNYHNNKNKNDKSMLKKNLQENKQIVHMIKTIISMDPKDPHLIVKCARTLMTLPIIVRDFNLGKQYLAKAFEMAPNDATVLRAIESTIQSYKDISTNQKLKTNETKQNQPPLKNKISKLKTDMGLIVKKQKNGEDPVPHLTNLLSKYDGLDKSKIMAQLCSYTILFKNNLKFGVEQFIKLIEQSGIASNDIITKHLSLFGSKPFNLSELICNEIRLATNLSNTSSDDMLYYYKMLTKIIETCNLKMKDVDSSMKSKLIVDLSVKSTISNPSAQNETESSDNESVDKNKPKKKNLKAKHLQKTGPKVFTHNVELKKGAKITSANLKNNKNASEKAQNKIPQPKTNDVNQMKVKMAKVLNSTGEGVGLSNKSKNLTMDSINNLEMRSGIQRYTQQLYQNILANTQSRFNSPNISSSELNSYFNQNHARFSLPIQSNPFQNPSTPPLLSLRPQLSPQNPKSKTKTSSAQSHIKKK